MFFKLTYVQCKWSVSEIELKVLELKSWQIHYKVYSNRICNINVIIVMMWCCREQYILSSSRIGLTKLNLWQRNPTLSLKLQAYTDVWTIFCSFRKICYLIKLTFTSISKCVECWYSLESQHIINLLLLQPKLTRINITP